MNAAISMRSRKECSIPVHERSKDTKEAAEHDLHSREDENRTIVDGTLLLDPTNKISANYVFDSRSLKLRYSYVHRGIATFEPCHDFGKNSWELAVSKTVFDGDVIRASYDTSRKVLDLEWLWKSSFNRDGRFKLCNNLI